MCILETPVTESWNPLQEAHSVRYRALVDREESPELCDSYSDVAGEDVMTVYRISFCRIRF